MSLVVLLFLGIAAAVQLRCTPTLEPAVIAKQPVAKHTSRKPNPELCQEELCSELENGLGVSELAPATIVDCKLNRCIFACMEVRTILACTSMSRVCSQGICLPPEVTQ